MMGVPLEGPDSVFVPALQEIGFVLTFPEDADPDTYYFTGDFYGIKSSLMVNVDERTKLLASAFVTCGPYHARELYDRNKKYLLGKPQREWGNFSAKGDGSLYLLNDYGYIQESQILHDNGSNSIRYFYLNSTPYYKDAANLGLKGQVQEVITENPIMENDILHFDETGRLASDDLIDREYNAAGYLVKAAMREAMLVARRERVPVSDDDLDFYVRLVDGLDPDGMPSMRQDSLAGRPTEVEFFAGTVVRKADALGLDVPVNRRLYRQIREMEQTR
jgi:hypothetical protein